MDADIFSRANYSAAEREEMAKKGWAMPDGSYPIQTAADVKHAVNLVGKSKTYSYAQVKAHIVKNAKRIGATSVLPPDWLDQKKAFDWLSAIDEWRRDLAGAGLGLFQRDLPIPEVRGFDGGTGDGSITIGGYGALYGVPTTLVDNKRVLVTESVAPGGCRRAIEAPDRLIHLNLGHDMNRAIASTDIPPGQVGGLELRSDSTGLAYFARADRDDDDARQAAVKLRSGVIRGASWKFRIADEERVERELDDGRTHVHYEMKDVYPIYDVAICAQGQYRQASSELRSYAAMAELLDDHGRNEWEDDLLGDTRRTHVGASDPAQPVGIGGGDYQARVVAMRTRVRMAATDLRKAQG